MNNSALHQTKFSTAGWQSPSGIPSLKVKSELAPRLHPPAALSGAGKPASCCFHFLPDGRKLAFAEFGHPQGFPLFYFHNHAGSRLEGLLLHQAALQAGYRLICPDRPGIGYSAPTRSSHLTFADDIIELAAALGLAHYGVMSWAGGTPFAFALAYSAPQKVRLLIALAPLPLQQRRIERMTFRFGFDSLSLSALRLYIGIRHRIAARDPAAFLDKLSAHLCHSDRRVLQDEEAREMLVMAMREAGRQGGSGLAMDTFLCLKPCEYMPEEISVPVQLWHGAADSLISAHQVSAMADRLADCTIRRAGNSGHFFFRQYAAEIFAAADERIRDMPSRSSFRTEPGMGTIRKPNSPAKQLAAQIPSESAAFQKIPPLWRPPATQR